jgi:hypothetical protein
MDAATLHAERAAAHASNREWAKAHAHAERAAWHAGFGDNADLVGKTVSGVRDPMPRSGTVTAAHGRTVTVKWADGSESRIAAKKARRHAGEGRGARAASPPFGARASLRQARRAHPDIREPTLPMP